MSDTYVIGIVGGSGSGKTTFLHQLQKELESKSVCFISSDDYYFPREQQKTDGSGFKNFDLPESIDAQSLYDDIQKLINGHTISRKKYNFNNKEAEASTLEYLPSRVIIVEGLFIYHYELLKDIFNLKIFIDAKENIKVIRRIKRDRIERNYDLEDVLYRYENHVLPSYEKYIKPYAQEADLIINNNSDFKESYKLIHRYILSFM